MKVQSVNVPAAESPFDTPPPKAKPASLPLLPVPPTAWLAVKLQLEAFSVPVPM
jgi:hypothetical protein